MLRGRERQTAALAVTVATTVSLALRVNSPTYLIPRAAYDDALFTYQAGHLLDGGYLGPYNELTLAKGPGYSFFIAAVHELHLPLKLAEHGLRLVAVALLALAVARIARSWALGVAVYVAVALDPSYLGWAGSQVARDTLYGTLALLLVAAVLLLVATVPDIWRRGPLVALPTAIVAGIVVGAVGAAYHLTREERIWIVPVVLAAGSAGVASWRAPRRHLPLLGLTALVALVAVATTWSAVDHVRDRNEAAYGTRQIGSLSEGSVVRAYAAWQRIDLGPEERYVPVNTEQRRAAYRVSPAAAELAPHLEGWGTRWMPGRGCTAPLPDRCEYNGAFVWVVMEAARVTGHETSGDAANAFYDRLADEIDAACADGRVPCVEAGPAGMPPLDRIDERELIAAPWRVTSYLLSYDYAEPGPVRLVDVDSAEQWRSMVEPIRGIDGTPAEYDAMARRAADRQQGVAALADVYRWAARLGVLPAVAGLVLAIATPTGRRRSGTALVAVVCLLAVSSRILVLSAVDATTFTARYGPYQLPATGFLIAFLVLGWWLLGAIVRDLSRARSTDRARGARGDDHPESGEGGRSDGTGDVTGHEDEPGEHRPAVLTD